MKTIQSTNNLYFKYSEYLEDRDSLYDNIKKEMENLEPLIIKKKYDFEFYDDLLYKVFILIQG